MFKWSSVAEEVADAMEQNQINSVVAEETSNDQKLVEAFEYLDEAARALDEAGLSAQAEKLTTFITKCAQDGEVSFEEDDSQTEPQAALPEFDSLRDMFDYASKTIYDAHRKAEQNPDLRKGMFNSLMYLQSVGKGEPNEQFREQGLQDWVIPLLSMDPRVLQSAVNMHFSTTPSAAQPPAEDLIEPSAEQPTEAPAAEKPVAEEYEKDKQSISEQEVNEYLMLLNSAKNDSEQLSQKDRENKKNLVNKKREYVAGILYLNSLVDGNPDKNIFTKYKVEEKPDFVDKLEESNLSSLKIALNKHLNKGSYDVGTQILRRNPNFNKDEELNNQALAKLDVLLKDRELPDLVPFDEDELAVYEKFKNGEPLSATDEKMLNSKRRKAVKGVKLDMLYDRNAKMFLDNLLNERELPTIVDFSDKELEIYRQKTEGLIPLTEDEESVLKKKYLEAVKLIKEEMKARDEEVKDDETRGTAYKERTKMDREQAKHEQALEQAPGDVMRIDPETGLPVQHIPVGLEPGSDKWKAMTPEERAKARKRRGKPSEKATTSTPRNETSGDTGSVYPEGKYWVLDTGDRKRKFNSKDLALQFGYRMLGEDNVRLMGEESGAEPKAPPPPPPRPSPSPAAGRPEIRPGVVRRRRKANSLHDLLKRAEHYDKCVKKVKNPGKTKEEKDIYKHYGYNDTNPVIDKTVPVEETADAEEYWEDD